MTDLLHAVGAALYGNQWQSAIARDLGVSDRTMRRWAAGTAETPAGLRADLLRLVEQRGADLGALAGRLRKAA